MTKGRMDPTRYYDKVMETMTRQGLLLGSYDAAGKANVMTIGWGALGRIWGVPAWIVLVRPSRYTWQCIEHSACFSVNVPTAEMHMVCATAGSVSGRNTDKFTLCNLTAERGQMVLAPTIAECPIVYECQVVHNNDVLPEKLAGEIISGAYMDGDYHRVYFGKVLAARAEADALNRLG